jgi:PAS domain S-box-containing protein
MENKVENASQRLLLLEGRYRLLVDAITDYAIYMLDPEGHVTSWNAGAQRFKGFTENEILGQHFSRFYTDEDRARGFPQRALRIAAEEGRFESEGWRVRKDGGRFWAHVILDPIRSPRGELIGFAKITRDLTERKLAEAELRRSEEQFRLLVEGVTDYAIYMLDPTGAISSWNLGAERIKGYTRDEVIGHHFSRFYTPEDIALDIPGVALATAAQQGRFETEGWRVRKDGSRFWASVLIDAIHDDTGAIIGFAKITRDITEKRETQRALDRAREELFQAQKMEAVGQLTGGVAHDFNNLLMAILGSLELLRKRVPETPEISRLVNNAIEGVNRGAGLTQRLLAFSRKQDLKMERVDIIDLVRNMTDLLSRSLGPAMVIETRFPLSLPAVQSDPNQLASALLNLAVNARDAMPQGGALTIGAQVATAGKARPKGLRSGNYVCLYVHDSGQGMDPETLEKATTPFFTTKGIGKGTGLGLSMVQGLMEQSGGKLVLHSESGKGTRAELWLPAEEEDVAPDIEAPVEEPQPNPRIRPRRILLVDDDALILMSAVMMLEDLGHQVREAASGLQALEILAEDRNFDLVVTDHAMPRMTGAELVAVMRERYPDLPVILASGYAELPVGMADEVTRLGKPFTQAQLTAAIDAAMAERR